GLDLEPIAQLAFLRILRMTRENAVDQIDQAGPAERRIVRLAASRRDVDFVARRPEPFARGARIRVPRVDASHRLPFEFSRHGQRARRWSAYAGELEHFHDAPRIDGIDDLRVASRI